MVKMGAFNLTVAVLLGLSFNMYLYGFVSYQYVAYKTKKFNDPIWLRTLVAVLFVIDTAQTAVELYVVWEFAVENYTQPRILDKIIWGMPFCSIATAISASIVQAFLISRLCQLTKQYWLCGILILVAFGAALCGIINSVQAYILTDVKKLATLIPLAIAWLAVESGIDIVTAGILSGVLWRRKSRFARVNDILNRCIRTTIQSGLFSSVCAILNLVTFVLWPETYLSAVFHWPLGRIHSNSLLHTLVSRKEVDQTSNRTAETRNSELNSLPISSRFNGIHIHRETVTDSTATFGDKKQIQSLDQYIVFSRPHRNATFV
ncbi:hypothetical protein DL96DRAFT_807808 [Flagelloscypha sp. PMI_526]|nr:hypothetical protein DL96DRAFT_807808 [Flagelloscypha sp. PMI_526]